MANFITLSAKLTADAADFNRQLGVAKKSVEDLGRVLEQQNAADKALADKAAGLRRQGEAYTAIGGAITRYVTLPLTLAGGAAIKMGADVEIAFSRLVGLAGVPANEVAQYRSELEAISKTTATTIPDLTRAAYTAASVGFRGAEGIDVLTRSAKASAAGLGDIAVVTKVITAAVNSYGRENLTAAQATDALVAAVTVGGAEADQLASSLGNVLSVSKAAGVSFQDTAAAVAALTAAGAQTDIAITGVRNAIAQFIDPAPEARKQLEQLGISVDDIRKTLADKGLLEALFQLRDIVDGNAESLSKIFPDMRGLVQVLNLLGQSPQAAIDAFNEVRDSTGALDKAFQAFKETGAARLKQALVDSQAQLIQLGDTLIPLAADILPNLVSVLKTAVDAFTSLPGPVQDFLVVAAGIAAISGPILSLVGNLKRLSAGIIEIGRNATTTKGQVSGLKTALGALATGATIGITIGLSIRAGSQSKAQQKVSDIIAGAGSDLDAQAKALWDAYRDAWDAYSKQKKLRIPGTNFEIGGKGNKDLLGALGRAIDEVEAQLKGAAADAAKAGNAFSGLGDGANDGAVGVGALADALDALDKKAAFADALDKLNEVAKIDPFLVAQRSAISMKQAQLGLAEAQDRYNDLLNRNVVLEQRRVEIEQRRMAANIATAKVRAEQAKADLQRSIDTGQSPLRIAEAQAALGEALVSVDEAQLAVNDAQTVGARTARELERASLDVESAELAVKEARAQLITVSEATRQKQKDLEAAFRDLVRLGVDPAKGAADGFRQKLIELRDVFPTLAGPINDVLALIAGAKQAAAQYPGGPYAFQNPPGFVGPVLPGGGAYASQNPPGFVGPVLPGAPPSTTINVNVQTNASPEQIAAAIDAELRKRNNRSFI